VNSAVQAIFRAAEESVEPAPTNSSLMMWVMLGAVVIAMFIMSRRSKRKQADANAFRSELAPGQRVMTLSGMIGEITRVEGDVIYVAAQGGGESAWVRRAIRSVVSDEEWDSMTADYPDEPADDAPADANGADEAPSEAEDASSASEGEDDDEPRPGRR
jgi:preprotein translocase subunit YajC